MATIIREAARASFILGLLGQMFFVGEAVAWGSGGGGGGPTIAKNPPPGRCSPDSLKATFSEPQISNKNITIDTGNLDNSDPRSWTRNSNSTDANGFPEPIEHVEYSIQKQGGSYYILFTVIERAGVPNSKQPISPPIKDKLHPVKPVVEGASGC